MIMILVNVREWYLFFKLCQCGRILGNSFLGMSFDLFCSQHVVVQKELSHKLVSVVQPQVSVDIERAAVFIRLVHYASYTIHQILAHLGQVKHVFHVVLEKHIERKGSQVLIKV